MGADVVIVGGGAVGVCCALELARRGAEVRLLERGPALASGCSAGNAGLICPSHSIPIANPVSLRNGLRWLFTPTSPFALRPRASLVPWLARFALAARRWREGADALRSLSVASLALHAQLGEELGTSFERRGLLNVYATEESYAAGQREAESSGLTARALGPDEARELEPALIGDVAGAVSYPDEAQVDPVRFVEAVGQAAADAGARIETGVEVRDVRELRAGTVVVAAGAWSRNLVPLPLEGGKGYHLDLEAGTGDPCVPVWVQDTWTIATPLPGRLRLSGTLELAGLDLSIDPRRLEALHRGGERWFRGVRGRPVLERWAGLRPCLPDGLPAIGRLDRLVVATGHAMKGVSLAPITGRLVAELVADDEPSHDLRPFDPARFSHPRRL